MNQNEKCIETTNVTLIQVEEIGRKATFQNTKRENYLKIEVDGCVMVNRKAADWLIVKPDVGSIIIELKGRDVEHAVNQISETAKFLMENKDLSGKFSALIVCNQFPRASPSIQKKMNSFRKMYNAPLHVVTKNYVYIFENVLSFKGPHKAA